MGRRIQFERGPGSVQAPGSERPGSPSRVR